MEQMISLIIPYCEDRTYLLRCLNAIRRQTYKNTEILLVANANDEKISNAKEEFPALQIVETSGDGKYAGLNQAIENAHGTYIMFCSMQSVPAPNVLTQLISDIESDSDTFSFGTSYISSGKDFSPYENTELNFYGKLFQREILMKDKIRLAEGFPLAEFLFVCQYLKHFQTIQIDENVYIYEMNTDILNAEYFEDTGIRYWDSLFESLVNLAAPVRDIMQQALVSYIEKYKIRSFDIMFSAEQNAHSLYGLNYSLSGAVLVQTWNEISKDSNGDNLIPFRNYLKCYEADEDFFQLLLSTCGLTMSVYEFLWKDPVGLLLIKEAGRNSIGEVISKKDFLKLRDDISNVKCSLTDLKEMIVLLKNEEVKLVQNSQEITNNNQITHILQVEDFVMTECREGRVGLKTIWKFGKAWLAYKTNSKRK